MVSARTTLKPLGVVQQGRSRTWVDDHGWWIVNVEFQPSGFSAGSYLNVGVQWLWRILKARSFMLGHRVEDFCPYLNEDQFSTEADRLADSAASEVQRYRALFPSVSAVADYFLRVGGGDPEHLAPADRYHVGVALGLVGQSKEAGRYLDSYRWVDDDRPWAVAERAQASRLRELLADGSSFQSAVIEIVTAMRATLKLPVTDAIDLTN